MHCVYQGERELGKRNGYLYKAIINLDIVFLGQRTT